MQTVRWLPALLCFSLISFGQNASLTPIANGVHAATASLSVEVSALREDVLRVRIGRDGKLPEDSSWAVLPAARTASVHVTAEAGGFSTKSLRVRIDGELRLTVSDLDGHVLQQDARPPEFRGGDASFRIYKSMRPAEHFFGLGDKVGPLDRRGMAFTDWNTDNFGWQESSDPIYKSIPFFLAWNEGRVLGVLFDNTWRASFDFGKEFSDRYAFGAPGGPATYYLLYGPGPKKVVETYAWLTGPTPLPPLWSLGFQQSRYSYYPESRVRAIADRLRADKIPSDAIYLDIDYQQNNRPFTVNRERFPHFEQMIKDLAQENFHTVVITDLHIAMLPGAKTYDEGAAGDDFVKKADGSIYVATVWPGASVFPDFTETKARDWWGTLYKEFSSDGIAGFWNDMNEPAVFNVATKTMPDDNVHRIAGAQAEGFADRTAPHTEIHNVFGMENARGTMDGLLRLEPNARPFVLTRASYAGGQRYSATWTGDNSSTWNHMRLTTPMLENLGLSGFAMSGADVGGFAGSPQPDLLTKWIELAAFQPIDRDHTADGTKDQEVWVHGPEQEAIRRKYIEERYKLLPYLYTAAETMSRTGVPIVRPLFLEFPEATPDHHPIDLDAASEFLFGADLLVAPPPYPDEVDNYTVQLPPGVWYDYWTGARIDRTQAVESHDLERKAADNGVAAAKPVVITPELAVLPVYARGGAVVPMEPLVQSTNEKPQGPLTLRVYLGAGVEACRGTLYQDDGRSFDYRRGKFLRMETHCEMRDGALHVIVGKHEGEFPAWWREVRLEVYGWRGAAAPMIEVAGRRTPAIADQEHAAGPGVWTATIEDTGRGVEVVLR